MEELKLGVIKYSELAKWFGIQPGSLRNKKKQKLEELRNFADFEEVYGGVKITNIKESRYVKNSKKAKELIKNVFDEEWSENGLDTCKNVSNKIYRKYEKDLNLAMTTTYNYTIEARNDLYGKPFESMHCGYTWGKVMSIEDNGEIIYAPFTEEEEDIKKKLLKKYFATDEEKEILIAEMVEAGEINKAEAYDLLCEYKGLNKAGFMSFKAELEKEIGYTVHKITYILRDSEVKALPSAF